MHRLQAKVQFVLFSTTCDLRRKLLEQFALSHGLLSHVCVSVTVCFHSNYKHNPSAISSC